MNTVLESDDNRLNPYIECHYYLPEELKSRINERDNRDDFSLLHLNTRSLNRNFESLQSLLSSLQHPFSVIGLSETWLNVQSPALFDLEDYTLLRSDRPNGRGGGVAMYIKKGLSYNLLNGVPLIPECETLFIEIINPHGKNVVIGIVYRPPSSSIDTFITNLDMCIESVCKGGKPLYLMGDFNINLLLAEKELKNNSFLTCLNTHSLFPLIDKPTRITQQSATLIDNIFTNILPAAFHSGIIYSDVSDHLPIFVFCKKIKMSFVSNESRYTRQCNDSNVKSLIRDLAHENWFLVYKETNDVNKAICIILYTIEKTF